MTETIRTGGCQCGAVRFRIRGQLGRASICHCRMCQKQFGAFFSALVTAPAGGVEWVRAEPSYFQSSVNIERGFCPSCGSPVTVKLEHKPDLLGLLAAGLDDPSRYKPAIDIFTASAWPWDHMLPETQKLPQGLP